MIGLSYWHGRRGGIAANDRGRLPGTRPVGRALVVPPLSGRTATGFAVLACASLVAGCAGSTPRQPKTSLSAKKTWDNPANYDARAAYDPKTGTSASPRLVPSNRTVPKGGGVAKLGKPYRISGRWYVPRHEPNYNKTGIASWYGDDFHGRKTANGEIYDMRALTAAHPTLPLPSYVHVTNLANNRTVLVRVNDRGPYAHNRIIDMSRAAAKALEFHGKGLTQVRVRYAGAAPLSGDDRRERQFLASQPWAGGSVRADSRSPSRAAPPRQVAAQSPALAVNSGRVPTWNWQPPGNAPAAPAGREQTYATWPNRQAATPAAAWQRPSAVSNGALRPSAGDRVFVQAGTFGSQANALRLQGRLAHLGAVQIDPIAMGAGTGYRVRLGPVPRQDGERLLSEVAAAGAVRPRLVAR